MHYRAIPNTLHYHQFGGGGGGIDKYYRGSRYLQAGGGVITDMFRHLLPIVSERLAPYLGERFAEAKSGMEQELTSGASMGRALKQGLKRAWNTTKSDVKRKLRGGGAHKKRLIARHLSDLPKTPQRRIATPKKKDYFFKHVVHTA